MNTAPAQSVKRALTAMLPHARISLRRSSARGHADHGWLNTYHTFSFASYHDPKFESYGCIRVLNEDRVAPSNGFPTHSHRDAEIFSYILNGELTHRDSMVKKGSEGSGGDDFYRMHRGDLQFTTGGKGIAHSETNESNTQEVHFLQIWALPWKRGLKPRYHTKSFADEEKRKGFQKLISPLKAGLKASEAEEDAAVPSIHGTIPVHADLVMGAGLVGRDNAFQWGVGGEQGGDAVALNREIRKVYVHLPMTKSGKTRVRLDGRQEAELNEGDGAFVDAVSVGDKLDVRNIGDEEAEVVVLDSG